MRRTLLLLTILSCFIPNVFSQTLQGVVYDNDGLTIPDVYIRTITNTQHAHANTNGEFSISGMQIGDTLYISHIGFETAEFIVQNFEDVEIVLQEMPVELDAIVIAPSVRSLNIISKVDLLTSPVNSSQEILRKVPGLIIGQHAGGGKAEQIFLRGFDIDHGTDVAISVDGMPVNMVTHAHGQGYADLHFLIPETIQFIDYGKGPYYAAYGNLNTAAYIDFHMIENPEKSFIKTELGPFNTMRMVALLDLLKIKNHALYVAAENIYTDGYFDASQHFNRSSAMIKYTGILPSKDKIGFTASYFGSAWDASGQIPMRAVDSIGRFGAIDSTEGGNTSRSNIALHYNKYINRNTTLNNTLYYTHYDFELFSNFTFYLEDPVYGDQILQYENRNLFGGESKLMHETQFGNTYVLAEAAIGLRKDIISDNTLAHTYNRNETIEILQLGDVHESNTFAFVNLEIETGKFLINPGIRFDHFNFNYLDRTQSEYAPLAQNNSIVSPKLNIFYSPSNNLQLYVKTGMGFHSNDTRVILQQNVSNALPKAIGTDVGAIWKPAKSILLSFTIWTLYMQQEFVYVGDAGIVELGGETMRNGVDAGIRFQPMPGLFFSTDITYSYARSVNEDAGQNYIPLAPVITATGGVSYVLEQGWYGSIRYRYLSDRPANEDYSVVAEGYLVTDGNLGYAWSKLDLGITIENMFNTQWNETQFNTESRLYNETAPVEEIHFTSGTPIFIKGTVKYCF